MRMLLLPLLLVGCVCGCGPKQPATTTTPSTKVVAPNAPMQELLASLRKPLAIRVYAPRGPKSIDSFVADIGAVLEGYHRRRAALDWSLETSDDLDGWTRARKLLDPKKATTVDTAELSPPAATHAPVVGLSFTYGASILLIDERDGLILGDAQGAAQLIARTLREIRDREDDVVHRIGYLQGHKEKGQSEMRALFDKYFPYYLLMPTI